MLSFQGETGISGKPHRRKSWLWRQIPSPWLFQRERKYQSNPRRGWKPISKEVKPSPQSFTRWEAPLRTGTLLFLHPSKGSRGTTPPPELSNGKDARHYKTRKMCTSLHPPTEDGSTAEHTRPPTPGSTRAHGCIHLRSWRHTDGFTRRTELHTLPGRSWKVTAGMGHPKTHPDTPRSTGTSNYGHTWPCLACQRHQRLPVHFLSAAYPYFQDNPGNVNLV